MGRGYVTFDEDKYIKDLRKALERAMDDIGKNIYKSALANLANVDFKRMDMKYRKNISESIRYATKATSDSVISVVRAGGGEQSFRALYYEYGTGSKMKPPKDYSPADDPNWNPERPNKKGAFIYFRKGKWVDMGGNTHFSKYKGKPRPIPRKSPYGQPISPNFWFKRGFNQATKEFDNVVLDAVKSVPISSYINIRDLRKRL